MGNPTIDPGKKARGSNQEPLRQEETEKMQKPPQIIVIPQSMLAGQKSLLRLAPSPMPRNTSPLLSTTSPSPLLSSASISPLLSSNPRPVAAVVGSKRPAPSPSPKDFLLDIKEEKKEDAEEPCGRPDRPGQEESSDRLDGEAACRGPGPPSGQPRCQRSALEDQHPAPDGERQPPAAEQRAASQTFPPLHAPSLPPSFPIALPHCQQPKHPTVHRALAS